MQVFISYRRADNEYLAFDIHRRLSEQDLDVFIDVASIGHGVDFPAVIQERAARSDAILVLIGPAWSPERLDDERDFVRLELTAAHDNGVRVIPVLHSGAVPPEAMHLTAELSWLPHLSMVRFGQPVQLESDIERLTRSLKEQIPVLKDLHERAWKQYEDSDHEGLLRTAEAAWREHADRPSPALADCCRTAALSLTRSGRVDGPRDLWLVRALSTAFLADAPHAFAATLLPFFFRMLDEGYNAEARQALNEISRMIQVHDPSQLPPVRMMRRIVTEKGAYLRFVDGDPAGALSEYVSALEYTSATEDARGQLKIRGAMALCHARLGDNRLALEELEEVLRAARAGDYANVTEAAEANIAAIDAGSALVPFEVL